MYIEKYLEDYIGGTDDCLSFLDYLADKQKEEISLGEIMSDIGMDKLNGQFRTTNVFFEYKDEEGYEREFHYAIDILSFLAALLLECKMNGSVKLSDLDVDSDLSICITATPEEHKLMNEILMDFVAEPLAYDLREMVPEDDMMEIAEICEELRKELYGTE